MFDEYNIVEDDNKDATIDTGPLLDMVFILLIFFVITTNFNRETGIDVTKPQAKSAVSTGLKIMLVGISADGTLHVYGRQIDMDRLEQLVEKEVKRRPDMSIVIVADKKAEIGKAVQVMDRCSMAGAKKVSIAADQN